MLTSMRQSPPEFPIIEKLGGRKAVADRLKTAGHISGDSTVRMWAARKSIPSDMQVLLMRFCERERIAYSASDFVLADSETDRPKRRRAA